MFYLNHAIVNPPIDRDKPSSEVRDVYLHVVRETDAGPVVRGAKVVATNSALTHYNFLAQNMSGEIDHEDFAIMFIAPDGREGRQAVLPRVATRRSRPRRRRPSTIR